MLYSSSGTLLFKMKLFSETLMHIMLTTIQIYVHNIYPYSVCAFKYGILECTPTRKVILHSSSKKKPLKGSVSSRLRLGVHVKQNKVLQHPSETAVDRDRGWALYLVPL